MTIYMLDGNVDFMAYGIDDHSLAERLMGTRGEGVSLPLPEDCPIKVSPRYGDAKKQPTKLGDFHRFDGRRAFSERAVDVLGLRNTGQLFPLDLDGREERFYWYWSTTVLDCLDNTKTKRLLHLVREPVFFEDHLGEVEMFTTPDDQKFQFHLYVTDAVLEKIRSAKLKGFLLRRGASDPSPWKS